MHARRRTHSPQTLGHTNKELHARSYIIMNFSLYLHSNQSLTQAESPPFSLSLSAEEVLRSPKKSCVTKLFQKPNTKPAISSSQQIQPQPQYTCWRRKRYSIRFGFVLCYITGSFDTPKNSTPRTWLTLISEKVNTRTKLAFRTRPSLSLWSLWTQNNIQKPRQCSFDPSRRCVGCLASHCRSTTVKPS